MIGGSVNCPPVHRLDISQIEPTVKSPDMLQLYNSYILEPALRIVSSYIHVFTFPYSIQIISTCACAQMLFVSYTSTMYMCVVALC